MDSLEKWLQGYRDPRPPEGFVKRVMARVDLDADGARVLEYNPMRTYGALCVAGALVMLVVVNSPLTGLFTELFNNVLEGIF